MVFCKWYQIMSQQHFSILNTSFAKSTVHINIWRNIWSFSILYIQKLVTKWMYYLEYQMGKLEFDTKTHVVTLWENSLDDMSYLRMLDKAFEEMCFLFSPEFTNFRWFWGNNNLSWNTKPITPINKKTDMKYLFKTYFLLLSVWQIPDMMTTIEKKKR